MAKIKILFFFICIVNSLSYHNNTGNRLNQLAQQRIVRTARSQIGVTESTGNNDGKMVENYLRYVSQPKGKPWCAAFVSWVFGKCGFNAPRTAWSPALFPKSKRKREATQGFVYGLYDRKKARIAHCGIVVSQRSKWVIGVEGNTNQQGSAEGDGVYLKWRHRSTIHTLADWTTGQNNQD